MSAPSAVADAAVVADVAEAIKAAARRGEKTVPETVLQQASGSGIVVDVEPLPQAWVSLIRVSPSVCVSQCATRSGNP